MNPVRNDTGLPHPCEHTPTKLFSSAGIKMYLISLQCEIAGIDDIKIFVLTLQLIKCCRHLGRALPTTFGKCGTDHRQRTIFFTTGLLNQMLTDLGDNSVQIVVIAVGCLHVALTLMPEQTLDIIIFREVAQTVVNLLAESFHQRPLLSIYTPVLSMCAVCACCINGCSAHRLLDYIKELLPVLLQQIVNNGIESPSVAQVLTPHSGSKRFEHP